LAHICNEWGLPENIGLAIKNHHNPKADNDSDTLGSIRIVSVLREGDLNNGKDEMIDKAKDTYKIPEERMQMIIELSFEKAKDLARMIV
jgi:HD-like signal output (HDOD) protein